MKYIIDSANLQEIQNALKMGAYGVTANPSMYLKEQQDLIPFLTACHAMEPSFLSGEAMGHSLTKMEEEVRQIREISPDIIIKLNFSQLSLQLCKKLHKQGIRTAVTLIFTMAQAVAAISAGADYLFPFIGRSDEYGLDGLHLIHDMQAMINLHRYPVSIVAASVKNLHQLESAAAAGVGYAAISYSLYQKSLEHPLTEKGLGDFERDWSALNSKHV